MGIRVHKSVGWATDQFNALGYAEFSPRLEALAEMSYKQFIAWMTTHEQTITRLYEKHNPGCYNTFGIDFHLAMLKSENLKSYQDPIHCVIWDDEFGMSNVILLHPLHMATQCHRYDDLIDWFEEDFSSRFRYVDKSIHPYDHHEIGMDAIAMCHFLGIEAIIPQLREALYVYWS